MIFGWTITFLDLMWLGVITYAALVFQMLVGTRRIKFKGRTHQKVHRWAAWTLFGIATVHGLLAMVYYFGWSVP